MNHTDVRVDALLRRLVWPSNSVRERACVALAALLRGEEQGPVAGDRLLQWLHNQELESVAALGILCYLQARLQEPSFATPSVDALRGAVARPSILTSLLIEELDPSEAQRPGKFSNSGEAPEEYRANPSFERYVTKVIAPIYGERAAEIEESTGIPFQRQWHYEWDLIVRKLDLAESAAALSFWGRRDRDHLPSADFLLSEAYRSAFLRALAWAWETGVLPWNEAVEHAVLACPIDLELWAIAPTRRPQWWPYVERGDDEVPDIAESLWERVNDLWQGAQNDDGDWCLAQAAGLAHSGTTPHHLELYGLLLPTEFRSTGVQDVLHLCRRRRLELQYEAPLRTRGSLADLQENGPQDSAHAGIPISGWIHPAVGPRWQYWRDLRNPIYLPVPHLLQATVVGEFQHSLVLRDGENIVARWNDWTDGLREQQTANLPPAAGQWLYIRRRALLGLVEQTGLQFGWVARVTRFYREHSYEDFRTETECRLFR